MPCDIPARGQSGSEAVHRSLHLLEGDNPLGILFREIGILHVDRQMIGSIPEPEILVVIVIELKQATCSLVNGNAVISYSYLLREAIRAAVMPVYIQIHGNHVADSISIDHRCHLLRYGVCRHRSVLLVGDEHPLAALGQVKGRLLCLFRELDAIRVLASVAPAPCAVATAAHLTALHSVYVGPDSGTVKPECAVRDPLLLGIVFITHLIV